jgi:hypothetical protein
MNNLFLKQYIKLQNLAENEVVGQFGFAQTRCGFPDCGIMIA